MSVKITYFVHGTTQDNIDHLFSGQNDIELSKQGTEEAKKLGKARPDSFDAIITSDLKRAFNTAKLAWGNKFKILKDERLRECNYGDLTQKEKNVNLTNYILTPFPNVESYKDVEERVSSFLKYLKENFEGKHVAIVAHQGPQLALEVLLKGKSWEQAIKEDWRNINAWQPGWQYFLN